MLLKSTSEFSVQFLYFSVPKFICFPLIFSLCWHSHFIQLSFSWFSSVLCPVFPLTLWVYSRQFLKDLSFNLSLMLIHLQGQFLTIYFLHLNRPCSVSMFPLLLSFNMEKKKLSHIYQSFQTDSVLGSHSLISWICSESRPAKVKS